MYRFTKDEGENRQGYSTVDLKWRWTGTEWKIKYISEKVNDHSEESWVLAFVKDSDGFACLRAGKGVEFQCFAKVPNGEPVFVERFEGDWPGVHRATGEEGFMHFSRLGIPFD